MKRGLIALMFCVCPYCWGQTARTGTAETKGPCSPAVTGDKNTFTINCGIDKKQGQRMLDILNKILANQLDPQVVMSKLDEILKDVNPNVPSKTYFCDGHWRTAGPGPHAGFEVSLGGDDSAFQQMIQFNNSRQYESLLKSCLAQMSSTPEWLTPRLFCGLAYLGTGDREKAKAMLAEFDSKTGPAYSVDACKQMSDYLHEQLK